MKQETLQLTGGAGASKRRELDYYPTPEAVTVALMDFLRLDPCQIWEPACGQGAMVRVLEKYGHKVHGSDICFGQDYFQSQFICDAIITNPPFNQSHLFIEKAVKEAGVVCLLLKSQYWHAKKRYELFMRCKPAYVLPLTWRPDFLEHERTDGSSGAPTMEVAWSVWQRGITTETKYIPLLKP